MKGIQGIEGSQELFNELQMLLQLITGLYDAILHVSFTLESLTWYSSCVKAKKVSEDSRMDVITAVVENRIIISKLQTNLSLTDTYESAYQSLLEARQVVDNLPEGILGRGRVLDLLRCLSGAFWNLGSSIYQTGRWDHSVPFISSGVEIDRRLLNDEQMSNQSKNDTWDVFYAQMPKRLLLLAGCFIRLGDRKVSIDTSTINPQTQPYIEWISELLRRPPLLLKSTSYGATIFYLVCASIHCLSGVKIFPDKSHYRKSNPSWCF
jgi:hypothetical protein